MTGKQDKYSDILRFARNHYENFPVVSFLVPKELQGDIAAIYWFARTADDIADEGNIPAVERLDRLEEFEQRFYCTTKKTFRTSLDEALFITIQKRKLNVQYFYDLLKAFKQDVVKKRYASYVEVLDYCIHSANPVGRLLLQLFKIEDEAAVHYSDKICTALQITNFLQDVAPDYSKGRIYLPEEELSYFGVDENVFETRKPDINFRELIKFNVDRTLKLFEQGRHLLKFLRGRFRLEINWTISGGEEILHKIRKIDYNVLQIRPSLGKTDFLRLLLKSTI